MQWTAILPYVSSSKTVAFRIAPKTIVASTRDQHPLAPAHGEHLVSPATRSNLPPGMEHHEFLVIRRSSGKSGVDGRAASDDGPTRS